MLALVTGAGSGIGAAIAEILSQNQFEVLLVGRDPKKLQSTAEHLKGRGHIFPCDLKNPESIERLVREVAGFAEGRNSGALDVLVNNAGIFAKQKFSESQDSWWMDQFQVNLMGPIRLTRGLYPLLKKSNRASVINISSTLGLKPISETSAYSAMKAALNSWTQTLALEWATDGICVNCVCPGLVDTPIHEFNSLPEEKAKQIKASLGPLQPLGRIGTPQEIAASVMYFCQSTARWTTGSILPVDGGISLM